jgi:transcriptional regulator with XRE-family HTH domain
VSPEFTDLLRKVAKTFRTQQAFAEALGMSPGRLNRALRKGDFGFSVLNCLRLAQLTDEAPSTILRIAGKPKIAELIEQLYGHDLTLSQRELIDVWERVPMDLRVATLALLKYVAEPALEGTRVTKRGRSASGARRRSPKR